MSTDTNLPGGNDGPYYQKEDRVSFDGGNYESVIDNNSWSPAVHPAGWKTV